MKVIDFQSECCVFCLVIFGQIDKMCTAYRLLVFIAGSSIGYIAQGKHN